MEQLLCHLVGDFWLQNDYMALNKKLDFRIALLHSVMYTLPFLFLTRNLLALAIICISHALIDGTHIVNHLNQIKNWNFKHGSGYDEETRPMWIWVWLLIIQDNSLHLIINYLTLRFIG